jgi:glycosyltransferase involved in cell wall biosynthesis
VAEQITFLGSRTGPELVELLNRHRILVTPSRLREPFGVVALEGIACGCAVVGSDQGGLPEAIGPCGRTFPNGDVAALADRLEELLADPAAVETLRQRADEHLAVHRRQHVGDAYLEVLEGVLAGRRPGTTAAPVADGGER